MIAIATEKGSLVRVLSPGLSEGEKLWFGFHRMFGFIGETAAQDRVNRRYRHGLKKGEFDWMCRFSLVNRGGKVEVQARENGTAVPFKDNQWLLQTTQGNYILTDSVTLDNARLALSTSVSENGWKISVLLSAILVIFPFLLSWLMPSGEQPLAEPQVIEQVTVRVVPERQKAVRVPAELAEALPNLVRQMEKTGGKGAIAQNLGFLGILGKKDLRNALGGMPSRIEGASQGAGEGGTEGSGGEYLAGIGQGVKRITVGNSGVAGLGGIGTKGRGGGAGGYGDSEIGSGTGPGIGQGDGRALSALPLSRDIVLDGGLERAVIQATIAKYLHEVRACYEGGLVRNPGLTGLISMSFEINSTGKLNFCRVGKSTLGDSQVEQCMIERMMGWQFPKPVGGVDVKVTYPFLLRPVNS